MKILLGISPPEWQKAVEQIIRQIIPCKIISLKYPQNQKIQNQKFQSQKIYAISQYKCDLAIFTLNEKITDFIENIVNQKTSTAILWITNNQNNDEKITNFIIKNNIEILKTPFTLAQIKHKIDKLILKNTNLKLK